MKLMRYYKKKKSSLTENNAYSTCLRKLNYRDYSYGELYEFLSDQEELEPEFIKELLDELVEFGYINEERFAESIYENWLNYSLKGKYYLIIKLNKHKINETTIGCYQEKDLTSLELDRALKLLQKYSVVKGVSIVDNKAKAAMHLKSQYYTPEIINRAISRIVDM